MSKEHRAGFVNIIWNPNVGKSTLMNALVGEKLCIVTAKAQTTRHRIMGIVSGEDYQIVYSDTPGILKPNYRLQKNMMNFVDGAIGDADIILYVTDTVEKADKNGEYNIQQSGRFAETFFRLLPSSIPVDYSPEAVGNALYWTKSEILQTLAHIDVHPLKQIYLDCPEDPYQRMWDPLTIIQAIEGDGYFSWSPQGNVSLQNDYTLTFTPDESGNVRYQKCGSAEQIQKWMALIKKCVMLNA